MGKPTFGICKNKGADQLRGSALVFATRTVLFLFYLCPNFQASSSFLYRAVCVRPGQNPNCCFSHVKAHWYEKQYDDVT